MQDLPLSGNIKPDESESKESLKELNIYIYHRNMDLRLEGHWTCSKGWAEGQYKNTVTMPLPNTKKAHNQRIEYKWGLGGGENLSICQIKLSFIKPTIYITIYDKCPRPE